MRQRKELLGAIVGGAIALGTILVVVQIIYTYYRRSDIAAIVIVAAILLGIGYVLFRERGTKIPFVTILKVVLVLYLLNIILDVVQQTLVDIYMVEAYSEADELDIWANILSGLTGNGHWLIGGLFVGVMTAVTLPHLANKSQFDNLPLLVVMLVVVLAVTFSVRTSIVHDTANGYGVSGFLGAPAVFGGMLVGRFVGARQGGGTGELLTERQGDPAQIG